MRPESCTVILGPLCTVMKHLASSLNVEVVGYIIGSARGDRDRVFSAEAVIMSKNSSRTPEVEFVANPFDTLVAHTVADNLGRDVIGVFHTHPCCAPLPSSKDIEGMKLWPLVWVIAAPFEVRAYLPLRGEILEQCAIKC